MGSLLPRCRRSLRDRQHTAQHNEYAAAKGFATSHGGETAIADDYRAGAMRPSAHSITADSCG